jgi:high affinity Mn2+ porin
MKGDRWSRPDDTFGLAGVVNGIAPQARAYFAAGGLGVVIGDGQLPRYWRERILEVYYKASVKRSSHSLSLRSSSSQASRM